eukprot:14943955-Ditylum_brightwellii.AAC.1
MKKQQTEQNNEQSKVEYGDEMNKVDDKVENNFMGDEWKWGKWKFQLFLITIMEDMTYMMW